MDVLEAFTAAEDPADALDRIEDLEDNFFFVSLATAITTVPADQDAARGLGGWTARFRHATILDVYGSAVLAANETASQGALLSAQGGNGVGAIYNARTEAGIDLKGLSFAAVFSSQSTSARRTAIPNGKFRQLPNTLPVALAQAEKDELDRKRINFYSPASGVAGETAEGQDLRHVD